MESSTENLIVISSDSHATVPVELWSEYLPAQYHEYLPRLRYERDVYFNSVWPLASYMMPPEVREQHESGGVRGVHDLGVRLAEMDREGITAELVYHGDFRTTDLTHNMTNDVYPFDVWDAGARAYDRWAFDTFGTATERLLLTGAIGSGTDMDASLAELRWLADHGFVGTFLPGFMIYEGMPPLFDAYWDPFWAECVANGLALVVHAGYGWEQGVVWKAMDRVYREVEASGSGQSELIMRMASEVFTGDFFADLKPRRPMWQLMLGGVFDRHPDLKLVLTEIRVDWIPATLAHLDVLFDEHRSDLPAARRPSEYFHSNCLAGASFVHKAEVEMRHEIGVETFLFGRDYPHPEGTWPNTPYWLRDAFAGVPEDELRLMLGENAIRFFGLDRGVLAAIAKRVGPTVADVIGPSAAVDPEIVAVFDQRGGYLKPAERDTKLSEIDAWMRDDLAHVEA